MSEDAAGAVRARVDAIYRSESRRVLATLIRLLGDFELAEEALHDAFMAALERWPRDGVPANPRPWLISTGRFKAIDALRRRARFDAALTKVADQLDAQTHAEEPGEGVEDDRLRLIFTCCHPALPGDAQVALTLREVCALTTEEIAGAFLSAPPTVGGSWTGRATSPAATTSTSPSMPGAMAAVKPLNHARRQSASSISSATPCATIRTSRMSCGASTPARFIPAR
jgi:RNA polymerase sigma factor (sigma-70 family)